MQTQKSTTTYTAVPTPDLRHKKLVLEEPIYSLQDVKFNTLRNIELIASALVSLSTEEQGEKRFPLRILKQLSEEEDRDDFKTLSEKYLASIGRVMVSAASSNSQTLFSRFEEDEERLLVDLQANGKTPPAIFVKKVDGRGYFRAPLSGMLYNFTDEIFPDRSELFIIVQQNEKSVFETTLLPTVNIPEKQLPQKQPLVEEEEEETVPSVLTLSKPTHTPSIQIAPSPGESGLTEDTFSKWITALKSPTLDGPRLLPGDTVSAFSLRSRYTPDVHDSVISLFMDTRAETTALEEKISNFVTVYDSSVIRSVPSSQSRLLKKETAISVLRQHQSGRHFIFIKPEGEELLFSAAIIQLTGNTVRDPLFAYQTSDALVVKSGPWDEAASFVIERALDIYEKNRTEKSIQVSVLEGGEQFNETENRFYNATSKESLRIHTAVNMVRAYYYPGHLQLIREQQVYDTYYEEYRSIKKEQSHLLRRATSVMAKLLRAYYPADGGGVDVTIIASRIKFDLKGVPHQFEIDTTNSLLLVGMEKNPKDILKRRAQKSAPAWYSLGKSASPAPVETPKEHFLKIYARQKGTNLWKSLTDDEFFLTNEDMSKHLFELSESKDEEKQTNYVIAFSYAGV